MTYHIWGDGFDFNKLNQIAYEVSDIVYAKTCCRVMWKEKYGTIRWEAVIVPFSLKIPAWARSWLCRKWQQWAETVMVEEIKKAAERHPDFAEELLDDLWLEEN